MNESTLQAELLKALRAGLPGAVIFKHTDKLTWGIPDLSVNWMGLTTWLELKYANPHFKATGMQSRVVRQLASAGSCWYVIYRAEKHGGYTTLIVDPREMEKGEACSATEHSDGLNHMRVVRFIKERHLAGR